MGFVIVLSGESSSYVYVFLWLMNTEFRIGYRVNT